MGEEPLGLPSPNKLKFAVSELLLWQAILTILLALPLGGQQPSTLRVLGATIVALFDNSVVAKCHDRIGLRGALGTTFNGAQRQYILIYFPSGKIYSTARC